MLNVRSGELPGLLILEPVLHRDARGYFIESYNEREFEQATGIRPRFVQDNHSHSIRNVVRGLHYQLSPPQGKLIRVVSGEIYDVVLDVRKRSPTLGQWHGRRLDASDGLMLWVPAGSAHGFAVLSDSAHIHYKTTEYWDPDQERTIAWDDPDLAIPWPLSGTPVLSPKDAGACRLQEAELIE